MIRAACSAPRGRASTRSSLDRRRALAGDDSCGSVHARCRLSSLDLPVWIRSPAPGSPWRAGPHPCSVPRSLGGPSGGPCTDPRGGGGRCPRRLPRPWLPPAIHPRRCIRLPRPGVPTRAGVPRRCPHRRHCPTPPVHARWWRGATRCSPWSTRRAWTAAPVRFSCARDAIPANRRAHTTFTWWMRAAPHAGRCWGGWGSFPRGGTGSARWTWMATDGASPSSPPGREAPAGMR
jgi:hypothetical protein